MQLKDYIKHAKRYGTDGVLETAISEGVALAILIPLQKELWKIDDANLKYPPRRRQTAEQRVRKLLGIEEATA